MNPPCKANPNWMPKNPKLMFQICQKDNFGFCNAVITGVEVYKLYG
jgi:hypothetical protein